MIRVENIKKTFNPHSSARNQVLKGVSFELPDKGLVAIFGKSGSGKTTLLNILGGLEKADSGKITVDGEVIYLPKLLSGAWLHDRGNNAKCNASRGLQRRERNRTPK